MTRLRQMLGQERGFALVIALAVTFVFSMTVVTVIEAATSNSRSSDRSKGRVSAYSLAEAGINNAASIFAKSNAYDPHVLHPQGTYAQQDCASPPANPVGAASLGDTCSPYSWTYDGGTTTMWGWFNYGHLQLDDHARPDRCATLSAEPQHDPDADSATIHVRAAPSQDNYVTAWNYVFVKDTTPDVCNIAARPDHELRGVALRRGQSLLQERRLHRRDGHQRTRSTSRCAGKIVWLSGASRGVGNTVWRTTVRSRVRRSPAAAATRPRPVRAHVCAARAITST